MRRSSNGSSCGWSGCASRSASPTRSTRARCASSATAATATSASFPRRSRSTPTATIPAELFLQLADLAEKPQLLSEAARRRDSELLVARLLLGAPRYLERVLHQLEADTRLDPKRLEQIYADLALLSEVMGRFAGGRDTEDHPGLRTALFHLRKLLFCVLDRLVQRRVSPEYLAGYVTGQVELVDPVDDLSEAGFFHALDRGDPETVNRVLLRLAERAFYRWLEDVCLDESNGAFEAENSPFASREAEVRAAISREHGARVSRGRELAPYLRRLGNRDALRLLGKLEAWFLRQYDIHHAAAMIQHADNVAKGRLDADAILSRHNTPNYVAALVAIASPFAAAAFFYDSAPRALVRRAVRVRGRGGERRRGVVPGLPLPVAPRSDHLPRGGAAHPGGDHRRLSADLLHRRGLEPRRAIVAHAHRDRRAARLRRRCSTSTSRCSAGSARARWRSRARGRSSCWACSRPPASACCSRA